MTDQEQVKREERKTFKLVQTLGVVVVMIGAGLFFYGLSKPTSANHDYSAYTVVGLFIGAVGFMAYVAGRFALRMAEE